MLISKKQKMSWVILFLVSTSVFATEGHIYLSGTLGASRAEVGNNAPQINYYNNNLTNSYFFNESHSTRAIMSGNSGYEFVGLKLIPAIALGLGIYGTPSHYAYSGVLNETATGGSATSLYNFKYDVNNIRIMAEAQFTWMFHQLAPFINLGIGPTWNHLYGYNEAPVNSTGYDALPPFQSRTNTNFAYQVGFGLGYAFNFELFKSNYLHERVSLGYRYVNLGNASFETRGQVYPYILNTGTITANELYLSYTHLF